METKNNPTVTIETIVNAPVEKVWEHWNNPAHITAWTYASDDWHAPHAENDLRVGGAFTTTMAAKDGSVSFDFTGTYTEVTEHKTIAYTLGDNRKVKVTFSNEGSATKVVETFDTESTHTVEMQRAGWQAILDNFKKYTEAS